MKRTILHFIYNLGRGGAETMLVSVLKELKEFDNIVVTLQQDNNFGNELECKELICLNCSSLYALPTAVLKLRSVIKQYRVDLVHSHLPQSNFIARLATPKSIPLINTIHTSVSVSSDYKKWYIRFLDKFTYGFRNVKILAVSQKALEDYFSLLKLDATSAEVLYTFVDPEKYPNKANLASIEKIQIVSVGSLREVKNHSYLLDAFQSIRNSNIELHIYGDGPLREILTEKINASNISVVLKGQVNNIPQILPKYNLYVMASKYEGFSLSVLEAMATRLPLLLSDIPSFREQCGDSATYFDLSDKADFVQKLSMLTNDPNQMKLMAEKAYNRVMENYTLQNHMAKLKLIYNSDINHS